MNLLKQWDKRVQAYTKRNDLLLQTSEQRRKWDRLLHMASCLLKMAGLREEIIDGL